MKPSAFSPRFILFLLLILLLSACGGAPAAATEDYPEAPAATEPPVEVAEEPPAEEPLPLPTQVIQGEVVATSPPVIAFPTPTSLPDTGGGPISPTSQPAIPERRRLTLEFPPQIRAGDSSLVILVLEVDEQGNITPTAQVEGNVVTGEVVEIPNLYETHRVIAEAQFDITGVEVSPQGLVSQTLGQGQSVSFYWSILPKGVGRYSGTVWLRLRFVDRVSGEESQRAVSAQIVEIEAVNLLGLSGGLARTFGVVGSIAGTVIGFPFLEDIVRFLFGRRRKK
jgi:hypothetical protein